jgi:carbon-monoxide dehydrogenase small subunit
MRLALTVDLIARESSPSRERVRREISGNLCRCTGYGTIVDAIIEGATGMRMNGAVSK